MLFRPLSAEETPWYMYPYRGIPSTNFSAATPRLSQASTALSTLEVPYRGALNPERLLQGPAKS